MSISTVSGLEKHVRPCKPFYGSVGEPQPIKEGHRSQGDCAGINIITYGGSKQVSVGFGTTPSCNHCDEPMAWLR
jgi:hypothetical protein